MFVLLHSKDFFKRNMCPFRPRRRSGSSIVVLGCEETIKSSLPGVDDYMGHCDYQGEIGGDQKQLHSSAGVDLEMLTMLSVNQDNGNYIYFLLI